MTVSEAAKLLKKSKQFVRVGLQRGILLFGVAVKMSSKWTYYINENKLYKFIGENKGV